MKTTLLALKVCTGLLLLGGFLFSALSLSLAKEIVPAIQSATIMICSTIALFATECE